VLEAKKGLRRGRGAIPAPARGCGGQQTAGKGTGGLGKGCQRVTWQEAESDSVLATSPALSLCEYAPASTDSLRCLLSHSAEKAWTSPQSLSLRNRVSESRPGLWGSSCFTLREWRRGNSNHGANPLQQGEVLQQTPGGAHLLGSFKTRQEKTSCRDRSCPGLLQAWGAPGCRSHSLPAILGSFPPEMQSEPGPQGQTRLTRYTGPQPHLSHQSRTFPTYLRLANQSSLYRSKPAPPLACSHPSCLPCPG